MTETKRRGRKPSQIGSVRDGVIKRSLSIAGHATSISLEEPFWTALKSLADARGVSLASLVAEVDGQRMRTNLSSALRVFVLASVMADRRYASNNEDARESRNAM